MYIYYLFTLLQCIYVCSICILSQLLLDYGQVSALVYLQCSTFSVKKQSVQNFTVLITKHFIVNLINLNYIGASKCNHHKQGFSKSRFQEENGYINQIRTLNRNLVQFNYYRRTRFVTGSTCKTRMVTHSTRLTTRSTCLPTRSTRVYSSVHSQYPQCNLWVFL